MYVSIGAVLLWPLKVVFIHTNCFCESFEFEFNFKLQTLVCEKWNFNPKVP